MFYNVAKANGWLYSDEKANELLSKPGSEWSLFTKYDKDENFLVFTPYIH